MFFNCVYQLVIVTPNLAGEERIIDNNEKQPQALR
ncbi:hypothetical protein SAMN04490355_101679 [Pelosinus propionicus DSM 13327]|uniref:Uncharacterized protein n=1 Tax=Pelosinus propionicus DSM 13327 TaxID=1123291 RepID=A0A1I4KA88_9FIRM|nr:hypothetical protein SAMN04490355_101679 [Pelosinus propionicus DSM 13327]